MAPRLILIDGMPGSGKTTVATAMAAMLPNASVHLENRGANPLHAFRAEEDVAEFSGIYAHSPQRVSKLSLDAWRRFVESAPPSVHIAESYPFQSGVRLLMQVDAGTALINRYVSGLERIVEPLAPKLIYLRTASSADDLAQVAAIRGREWFASVIAFFERSTWARNRALMGQDAVYGFMGEYAARVENLLSTLKIPCFELPGGKDLDSSTAERALAWI